MKIGHYRVYPAAVIGAYVRQDLGLINLYLIGGEKLRFAETSDNAAYREALAFVEEMEKEDWKPLSERLATFGKIGGSDQYDR